MSGTAHRLPARRDSRRAASRRHRRELSEGRAALETAYRARPNPLALLRLQAQLVDRVLRTLWREAHMPNDCALLAVGGYGRGTLFPYSDVDVLILLPDAIDNAAREQVSDLVSQLWDVGLELGHSVRTIAECIDRGRRRTSRCRPTCWKRAASPASRR